jgi:hypothetical protein
LVKLAVYKHKADDPSLLFQVYISVVFFSRSCKGFHITIVYCGKELEVPTIGRSVRKTWQSHIIDNYAVVKKNGVCVCVCVQQSEKWGEQRKIYYKEPLAQIENTYTENIHV